MRSSLLFIVLVLLQIGSANSQDIVPEETFSLQEFLAMVKKHHPVVAQANLKLSKAEAKLLKARGAFDPKLSGGFNKKNYKNTKYYELWEGNFKIPTWYGVDLKAGYQQTEGTYLNPQNKTPKDGLFNAGISINLLEGMIFNQRMNSVKKAKLFQKQNELKRDIQVNKILASATKAYINWLLYYQNTQIFEKFLGNAKTRFNGVASSTKIGETSAIDTVETKITVNKRTLELQQNKLNLRKARLYLSNFLWIDNVPIQLDENLKPALNTDDILETLQIENLLGNAQNIEDHPKLKALDYQMEQNKLDIRFRQNNLLPDIDLQYNFINETINDDPVWNTQNYKAGISVKFPLFLRKERGELRLAKIEQERTEYERDRKRWELINKINASQQAVISLSQQLETVEELVQNNKKMTKAERRLFQIGESSIFLVNTRENKLIKTQLKENLIRKKLYNATVKLFEALRLKWN